MPTQRCRQRGLTLVELMVGLALSLFLLAGLTQIFVSTRQAYRANEGLSRLQESGRFALELLSRDVRSAGYKGSCGVTAELNNLLDPDGPGYHADLYDLSTGLIGWDDDDGTHSDSLTDYRAGSDVLLLKHAANSSGATASGNTPANANTINLTGKSGIKANTIVLVSDVQGCDIFQNRSNESANSLTRGNSGAPGNLNPGSHDFSHAYDESMEILTFRSALYYVGVGAGGLPALRRHLFDSGGGGVDEEFVEGILDMQLLYGEDADGDLEADDYVDAGDIADWDDVVSVRVCVVAISTEANTATGGREVNDDGDPIVQCNGKEVPIPDDLDDRLARAFTTTIGLRNRLP